jgi:uncharacterized membrane protein YfcA
MMVATAVAMLRGRKVAPAERRHDVRIGRVLVDGLVVGVVTGLVGAGGGFLVVPALALLGGLPMGAAVGTSLLVITMKSVGGLAGYLSVVSLDWPLVLAVTAAAVVGSVLGGRLVGRIPERALRQGFGWFVLVMGGLVLAQQVPGELAMPLLAGLAVIVAAAAACHSLAERCPLRRHPARVPPAPPKGVM